MKLIIVAGRGGHNMAGAKRIMKQLKKLQKEGLITYSDTTSGVQVLSTSSKNMYLWHKHGERYHDLRRFIERECNGYKLTN
jgi:hypothetical protein